MNIKEQYQEYLFLVRLNNEIINDLKHLMKEKIIIDCIPKKSIKKTFLTFNKDSNKLLREQKKKKKFLFSKKKMIINTLTKMSVTDKLTGLYDKEYYFDKLADLIRKKKFPITIVMMDLDNFKQINDTKGHMFGDKILKLLAKILWKDLQQRPFFSKDLVFARFGGDEFTLLAPKTDIKTIYESAKDCSFGIGKVMKQYSDIPITFSCGVATLESNKDSDIRNVAAQLISKADAASYYVKYSGKNNVHIYEPSKKYRITRN